MEEVTELFLIRHAQTDWNAERRLQGRADRPLSDLGRSQASQLHSTVGNIAFDAVLCSDLRRTRETAELAGLVAAIPAPQWREVDVGRWSGRRIDDIISAEPEAYAEWRNGHADPPGGEAWAAFYGRVRAALSSIVEMRQRRVAIVTHSGVIRAILRILGTSEHHSAQSFDNATITKVVLDAPFPPLPDFAEITLAGRTLLQDS